MSNLTPPPSYLAITVSLIPKLTALAFLYSWFTVPGGGAPVGKLCLVFGVLALFDAVTLASLRKGSVAIEWPDIGLIVGGLIGPAVLPLYTAVLVGVIALGGNEGPETKRMLGGPGQERLAGATPTRFTAPTRPSSGGMVQTNAGNGPGMNVNANGNPAFGNRGPMPPGAPSQAGIPKLPQNGGAGGPSGGTAPRPPFGNPQRPVVATPTASQRPITKEGTAPGAAAPVAITPGAPAVPAPAPAPAPSVSPAPTAAKP